MKWLLLAFPISAFASSSAPSVDFFDYTCAGHKVTITSPKDAVDDAHDFITVDGVEYKYPAEPMSNIPFDPADMLARNNPLSGTVAVYFGAPKVLFVSSTNGKLVECDQ